MANEKDVILQFVTKGINEVKNSINQLQKPFTDLKKVIQDTNRAVNTLSKNLGKGGTAFKDYGKDVDLAGDKLGQAGKKAGVLGDKLDTSGKKASTAGKNIRSASRGIGSLNTALVQVTASLGVMSAALIKMGRTALDEGVKFEQAMRNVNSIAQVSEETFQRLSEGAREVAKRLDVRDTATGVANAMYTLVSSGIDAGKALDVAATASRAASAGMTDTQTAVRGLTALMNSYNQKTTADAIRFSDELFKVVDKGVLTFEGLATNLGSVVAISSSLGVQFKEVGAAFIELTRAGIPVAEAETAIASLVRQLGAPTEAAKKRAKELGVELGQAAFEAKDAEGNMKGLAGVLADVVEKTGGTAEGLKQVIPDFRGLKAAIVLSKREGQGFTQMIDEMNRATEGLGATQKALDQQMKSFAFSLAQLQAYWADLKIEVTKFSVGALKPLVDMLKALITIFVNLDDDTKQALVTIGMAATAFTTFAAAVSALMLLFAPLISVLGVVAGAFSTAYLQSSLVVAIFWKVVAAITALNPITAAIALTIGNLSLVFIGLYENVEGFRDAVDSLMDYIGDTAMSVLKGFKDVLMDIVDGFIALGTISANDAAIKKEIEDAKTLTEQYLALNEAQNKLLGSTKDFQEAGERNAWQYSKSIEELKKYALALRTAANSETGFAKGKLLQEIKTLDTIIKYLEDQNAQKEAQKTLNTLFAKNEKELEEKLKRGDEKLQKQAENDEKALKQKLKSLYEYRMKLYLEGREEEEFMAAQRFNDAMKEAEKMTILTKGQEKLKQKFIAESQAFYDEEMLAIDKKYREKKKKEEEKYNEELRKLQKKDIEEQRKQREKEEADKKEAQKALAAEKLRILNISYESEKDLIEESRLDAHKNNLIERKRESDNLKANLNAVKERIKLNRRYLEHYKGNTEKLAELNKEYNELVRQQDILAFQFKTQKFNEFISDVKGVMGIVRALTDKLGGDVSKGFRAVIDGIGGVIAAAEKGVSTVTNFASAMQNANYIQAATIAAEELGQMIAEVGDAFTQLGEDIEDNMTTGVEATTNLINNLIFAIPIIGDTAEAFYNLGQALADALDGVDLNDAIASALQQKQLFQQVLKDAQVQVSEYNNEIKNLEKAMKDFVSDREKAVKRAYDYQKKRIKEAFNLQKEVHEDAIKGFEAQIDAEKRAIDELQDKIDALKEQPFKKETATAFQGDRAGVLTGLDPDFFRTPMTRFELESKKAIENIQADFIKGNKTIKEVNDALMNDAIRRNIYYSQMADNLKDGTREQFEMQQLANQAYEDYANLRRENQEADFQGDIKTSQQRIEDIETEKEQEQQAIKDLTAEYENLAAMIETTFKDRITGEFLDASKVYINNLETAIVTTADKLSDKLGDIWSEYDTHVQAAKNEIQSITTTIPLYEAQLTDVELKASAYETYMAEVQTWIDNIDALLASIDPQRYDLPSGFPTPPQFATGGISTEPSLVSEFGQPEAIFNANQMKQMFDFVMKKTAPAAMSGGGDVYISFGNVTASDPKDFVRQVMPMINKSMARQYRNAYSV